ncbi:MAG: translation initiation factor IF-2 [Clostridia bacterium]|nr:translation initiation factor IF-2 [Clostridia bacterium]
MSNNENKDKMSLEAIKSVQEQLKSNAISSLLLNIKKAKTTVEKYVSAIRQKQTQLRAAELEKEAQLKKQAQDEQKLQEEKKVKAKKAEETAQAPEKPASFKGQHSNATKTRVFDDQRRPGGSFAQNGQRQNGTNRPFDKNARFNKDGQKPFGPRPSGTGAKNRPVETYDASTLIKKDIKASAPKKKTFDHGEDKKAMNKKALVMRGYVEDESLVDDGYVAGGKRRSKKTKETQTVIAPRIDHAVITTDNLTVKLLAEKTGRSVAEIMSKFLMLGMNVNINSSIDFDSAELICTELGVTLEKKHELTFEEQMAEQHKAENEKDENMVKRPPVITVMGHVDHGKTSLLDYIRKTNITSGEAGGITQHIGAYTISVSGQTITFIDTPGHAAFTAMRKRGANLTDIAILVVAADDGVMPQTIEAIKHIKEAKVPMIVAINKIDTPTANVEKIKQQLTEHDVVPEEWGGDAIMLPISAKTGEGIDKLLEMLLFVSDYQELKANPNRPASGSIIEAKLDKGMGSVATVLVQNGTLHVGDYVLVGTCSGKVRAMTNDKGKQIKEAGPSIPVSILGLTGVPNAGDSLYVVDEKLSKQVIAERIEKERMGLIKKADLSVDSLMNKITESNFKDYNVIIKGDVAGTVEALKYTLSDVANDEVKVRCIHGGVGAINENDVMLAQASHAVIIGFNVKPDFKAKLLAEKYKVDIKFYKIIYEAIEFVTKEIEKLKTPKYQEVVSGHAEVRQLFKASKVGIIAGSHMLDGKITKTSKARILRKDAIIFDGAVNSLQREKNEVKEVLAGFDFGVTFENFTDLQVGDIIEAYSLERI